MGESKAIGRLRNKNSNRVIKKVIDKVTEKVTEKAGIRYANIYMIYRYKVHRISVSQCRADGYFDLSI